MTFLGDIKQSDAYKSNIFVTVKNYVSKYCVLNTQNKHKAFNKLRRYTFVES